MPPIIEVENVSKRYSRNANTHLSYGLTDLLDEILGRKVGRGHRLGQFMLLRLDRDDPVERDGFHDKSSPDISPYSAGSLPRVVSSRSVPSMADSGEWLRCTLPRVRSKSLT